MISMDFNFLIMFIRWRFTNFTAKDRRDMRRKFMQFETNRFFAVATMEWNMESSGEFDVVASRSFSSVEHFLNWLTYFIGKWGAHEHDLFAHDKLAFYWKTWFDVERGSSWRSCKGRRRICRIELNEKTKMRIMKTWILCFLLSFSCLLMHEDEIQILQMLKEASPDSWYEFFSSFFIRAFLLFQMRIV